jgi:hypothetical protein
MKNFPPFAKTAKNGAPSFCGSAPDCGSAILSSCIAIVEKRKTEFNGPPAYDSVYLKFRFLAPMALLIYRSCQLECELLRLKFFGGETRC